MVVRLVRRSYVWSGALKYATYLSINAFATICAPIFSSETAERSKGLAKSNRNPCIGYPVPIGCKGVLLLFEDPFLVAHCLHVVHYTHIHMLIPDQ
ncbi:hypothetical protein T01_10164 [Trichinella spiralis]|uniref:Uncharacterized protein n=1 Tax=Trichinella spiralis TaxID=6334 RepID=A0A0V1C1L1_TRISP|nr:hypothetical protein T01_10164 [Trichinella spiralis]